MVLGVTSRRAGVSGRRRATLGVVGAAVAFLAVAAAHGALLRGGPLDRLAREGGQAVVEAVVAAEPHVDPAGWWTVLRVDRLDGRRTRERAMVRGDGAPPVLGQRLALVTTARPLDTSRGFGSYLRRRHVVARLDPVSPPRTVGPPGWLVASTEHVRARTRQAAARGLGGDRAGLAVGLVTGDTRLLSPATVDRMAEVGLTHLVAVSGSNVAIVVAGVLGLVGLLGGGARVRRLLVALAVAWFVVLTRAEPSVLRAAVMAGAVLLADARGVGTDAVHGLAVAVVVLLAADPALAGSLGLLLSVAATAGVLVVAPRIASRLGRLPSSLATLASVTLGAQLAVAPVLLVAVGEVPLASVPANLLAVPAAAVASTVAGLAAIVALVHVGAGAAVVALADPPLRVVLAAARVPDLPVVSVHQPAVLLLAVAAAGWLLAPRRGALARVAIAGVALGAALLVPVARPLPAVLTVTAIDVGQGDAVLVEGGGARILVDGGPDEDAAAAWLRRRGIRRLDLVVLTHPHADHATGLPTVLDRLDVGAVWLRPVEGQDLSDWRGRGTVDVGAAARAAGIPVREPVAGQQARVGQLVVHVLSPPRGQPFVGLDAEVNEMSLVLRVDHEGRRALLAGDAERAAVTRLLAAPERLRAGLLKVPHHGSATTPPELSPPSGRPWASSASDGTTTTATPTPTRWPRWPPPARRWPARTSTGP